VKIRPGRFPQNTSIPTCFGRLNDLWPKLFL
jgi:hypothetical protein